MDTKKWGKHGWIFLHYVTFNYPINPTQQDIDNYYDFFYSLKFVLPCEICKKHFSNNLLKHNLIGALKTRNTLIRWLIDIHNNINYELGKPILSYDKALQKLDKVDNNNYIYYSIILITLIIIIKKILY